MKTRCTFYENKKDFLQKRQIFKKNRAMSISLTSRFITPLNSGTAGDSLAWHKEMPFTTIDRSNGDCDVNCAERYHGAWWYADLKLKSNLNGRYYKSAVREHDGVVWQDWQGFNSSLKATEMKVRGVHV